MTGDQLYTFNELGLTWGQEFTLYPDPTDRTSGCSCVFIGCLPDEAVIVTLKEGESMPRIEEGGRVVLSVALPGGIALFPTTILYISEIPALMIYLDYPRNVKFKQIRSASRVEVRQPILLENVTLNTSGIPGQIIDISTSGAGLMLFEDGAKVGNKVEVKGKFQIEDISRRLTVTALVRAYKKRDEGYFCGIQFMEADEDKLLVLLGFIYHAMSSSKLLAIK